MSVTTDAEEQWWAQIRWMDESLASSPENAQLHHRRARLYQRLGNVQWGAGKDPADAYRCSIEAANASLTLNPTNPFTLQVLGDSLSCLGEQQADQDEDPSASYMSAVKAYDRGVALRPKDGGLWNGRCIALRLLGEWLSNHRADPTEALTRAIESGDAAVGLDPDIRGHYSLARANLAMAIWMVRRGKDPDVWFRRAIRFTDVLRSRSRTLNGAEAGWLSMRQYHFLKQWWRSLGVLREELRAHCDRPEFRAIADRSDRLAARH